MIVRDALKRQVCLPVSLPVCLIIKLDERVERDRIKSRSAAVRESIERFLSETGAPDSNSEEGA